MDFKNLLLLSSLLVFASCKEEVAQVEIVQNYKTIILKKEVISLPISYSASIRGKQDIKIIPRVDGHLTDVGITEGSKVKKGQMLFIIDQVPYEAALRAAKANIAVAQANVSTAKLTLNSKKNLYKSNVISEFDLLTSENNLKTAQAQLELAKSQELSASNNLSYTEIKSPSDGIVGKLPYRLGDYVSPAIKDGLTIVSNNSEMYIYFSMSERQILDLSQEYTNMDSLIIDMPNIELMLSNQTIYPYKGKVESISGLVDTKTGSVSIRAAFPNAGGRLLSGGAGRVIMPHTREDVIIIPQEATFEIQDKIYIYKIVNGMAKSTIITIDKINDGREYIVTSGLQSGETIIIEGAGLVREGTKVGNK